MNYADGLKDVLIRKINKTEKNLYSLKLDYCRFVFGLTHRTKVVYDQVVYQVRSVDLDSMERGPQGEWSKPVIKGVRFDPKRHAFKDELIDLGTNWEIFMG
ncbi:MAG: hypothetical protein R3183_09165 [Oleiphilaceae bacterium]|nr:hypothetical protein [Oleiphilaceae bacterium]